jgi:hypothetical protein
LEESTFDTQGDNDGGVFMVEDFGFVCLVADVGEDVSPGYSIGTTNNPRASNISEGFPDVYPS